MVREPRCREGAHVHINSMHLNRAAETLCKLLSSLKKAQKDIFEDQIIPIACSDILCLVQIFSFIMI